MIVAELWKIANEVTNPKSEQNWKLNLDGEIVLYISTSKTYLKLDSSIPKNVHTKNTYRLSSYF